jgi:hypothetical protein
MTFDLFAPMGDYSPQSGEFEVPIIMAASSFKELQIQNRTKSLKLLVYPSLFLQRTL